MNPLIFDAISIYAALRFLAGVGLAGELGGGITLVSEVMSKENRGYGTMIVATLGMLGAVTAYFVTELFHWRNSYFICLRYSETLSRALLGWYFSRNCMYGNFLYCLIQIGRNLRKRS